ncbi:MAG TPA: RNA methyltransferase [Anaerolineaceae bacterium]
MEEKHGFVVYECIDPKCRFRFSIKQNERRPETCPACKGIIRLVISAYDRHTVQKTNGDPGRPLVVLLDNIRSAWNVGSIFRTADGAGVKQILLVGVTPLPGHAGVCKTGLGAEKAVNWIATRNGVEAAKKLREEGYHMIALEGGERAISIFDFHPPAIKSLALVVGNEVSGVDPGILDLCDEVVYIPMSGIKGSLNVAVAFGIAVYQLRYRGN